MVLPLKTSAYIATSLDGFIARKNGELDWLPAAGGTGNDGDYGYAAFMDTIDYIVMGRHTFKKARLLESGRFTISASRF